MSKYIFTAEQFAKGAGCVSPLASLNVVGAGYETFTVGCAKADPMCSSPYRPLIDRFTRYGKVGVVWSMDRRN